MKGAWHPCVLASMLIAGSAVPAVCQTHGAHAAHPDVSKTATSLGRSARVMPVQPVLGQVPLEDQDGRATTLQEALDTELPVFLNFIFTTCTTVCPVMSTGFARLNQSSTIDPNRLRLVSISIDPDLDSVDALRAYAQRFGAAKTWRFLTGTVEASIAAQRAFGVYRGDKMNHTPATFVRPTRGAPWQFVEGLSSAETLLSLFHALPDNADR